MNLQLAKDLLSELRQATDHRAIVGLVVRLEELVYLDCQKLMDENAKLKAVCIQQSETIEKHFDPQYSTWLFDVIKTLKEAAK